MSGDPYQFWKQLNRASNSAFMATPAVYRIMDQFATQYDQLSNSSSLSPDSALTETKMLDISGKMQGGVLKGIEEQIYTILASGAMQSYFGGQSDPISAQARSQAQQDQIKKIIESKTSLIEHRMKLLAKIMYENALADEQTEQLNKLAGSDMASASGYSEEKINAMEDLSNTVTMEPDDLEFGVA